MGRAISTVIGLESGIINSNATTEMKDRYRARNVGGDGIEAGGRINIISGSSDVIVRDQNGVELFNALLVSSDTTIAPVPRGVSLPLEVVTTNLTGSLEVFWAVKK